MGRKSDSLQVVSEGFMNEKFLSAQQIYDKVKAHLLSQRKKAKRKTRPDETGNDCAYRTKAGLSCAIGCLIPAKAYIPAIEGMDPGGIFREHPEIMRAAHIQKDCTHFLEELQMVHDDSPVQSWKRRLAEVAEEYGLNP